MAIDYDAAKREHPKLKAMLTRAGKDPVKVRKACRAAIEAWDRWGAWPDDWSKWQRALDDSMPFPKRAPRLDELQFDSNPAGKPRRSTSLAGLDPAKKWHRKCPFCTAKTNIDRLGSSSRTWQQWRCPECGKWVDRHSGGPRRNPTVYAVTLGGSVVPGTETHNKTHAWKWADRLTKQTGRKHSVGVKVGFRRTAPRSKGRLNNPSLGMPGMPHTWVTRSGEHVRAGDQVEFWSSEGGYHDRKKVRRRATVMRYLVFDDHVQVKMGVFGTTVDDGNFIRVTRRGR